MLAARLAMKRSRARGSLLLALFGVVSVTTFLLAGMVGYLAGTSDAAVRETLTDGPATAQAVQVTARLATDRGKQADDINQLIGTAFGEADAAVHRTVRSTPVAAQVDDGSTELILMSDPQLAEYATVTAGDWPATDGHSAAVHTTAAEKLSISVGDRFTVDGTEFVVAATWLPKDATDPRWFADPAVASGADLLSLGPVVVSEDALAALPVRTYAQWTLVPGASALTAEGLPRLANALDQLTVGIDRADSDQNIELAGTLPDSIHNVQRSLGVAGALVTVPGVLVAVIGLITLAQLSRLLVSVRRSETEMLRARGASVTTLTVMALGEFSAVIVPGSAVGAAAVVGLLASGLIPVDGSAVVQAVWPIAIATAAVAILISVFVCWRAARSASAARRGEAGRTSRAVTLGVSALVLIAAGVSVWQFKLYGSPLVVGPDGDVRIDPLTVVAPALLLVALAMIGLIVFSPVARLLERWSARGRGILPALPVRQVARRLPVFGVALLLVTLSVSGTTLTAVYSQTWTTASHTAAQLGNGADVRVRLSTPATVDGPASRVTAVPYLRLAGVTDAATVLRTSVRIADDSVGLTAMAAERMPELMHRVDGAIDPAQVAAAFESDRSGVPLDGDELTLTVSAGSSAGQTGLVDVSVWLDDADGSLALVPVGRTALVDEATLTVALPESREGGWTALAVQATLSAADGARGVELTIDGVGDSKTLTLSSVEPTARALTYSAPTSLPVVVTEQLARRLTLEEASTFSARIPSTASAVGAEVVGTTPAIPASAGRLGMIADLGTLGRYLLASSERMPQASEVWMSTDHGADLEASAVAVSNSAAQVTSVVGRSADRLVAPTLVALWWGTAGALLLAAIAVFAITSTFAQDRRGEVIVLRALGMSSTEQARNRLLEMISVLAAAVVTGIVAGLIASALTVVELATTATGDAVPIALRFGTLGWVALVFALVAALVTISTGYAGRVARQARDTEYREETR